MTANAKSVTYKSIVGLLIMVLISLISLTYWDVRGELTELKHTKADKEVVELQLNYISQTVSDIKNMVAERNRK